jgi:molybdenum cofactor cytidylyltransferase
MPSPPDASVTALVLAAGASRRLGRPKQLLPYGDGVLLDAVLSTARSCDLDQIVVALGGAGDQVRAAVDLSGCDVVDNPEFGTGCSSSISAALPVVRSAVLLLLLGDQPGVRASAVSSLLSRRGYAELAVCRYSNGRGHPFAFARSVFPDLAALHGDKGVWKLLDQRSPSVVEVPVAGPIPLDVDTEDDYRRVLSS